MRQPISVLVMASLAFMVGCDSGGTSITCTGCMSSVPTPHTIYTLNVVPTTGGFAPQVLRFDGAQSGSVNPDATITLPGTYGISIATDNSGNLYVLAKRAANMSTGVVYEYAATASGVTTPTSTFTDASGQFFNAVSVAVDASGQVYVLDGDNVEIFGAGARGSATPVRSFALANFGTALVVDTSGNVYVASAYGKGVYVYGPTASGAPAPTRILFGTSTGIYNVSSIAVDATGELIVGSTGAPGTGQNVGGNILVFAAGASGNVAPVRSITGSNTGFTNLDAVAVDSSGAIYEVDSTNSISGNYTGASINIFPAGANGNVAPTAKITSPVWLASSPASVLAVF